MTIQKLQDDLINKKFVLKVDSQSARFILKNDVKNLASKQIFARWQTLLSAFDFTIEHIKGSDNSLPYLLTKEFLQGGP